MVEKDIQGELGEFINRHNNDFNNSFTFEVKLVKNKYKRYDFSKLEPHQKRGLQDAMFGYYYKDSDAFISKKDKRTGSEERTQKKHRRCDAFFIKSQDNYVAIAFWQSRKHKMVYFIQIFDYLRMESDFYELGAKSCHENDIREYAEFSIDLLSNRLVK